MTGKVKIFGLSCLMLITCMGQSPTSGETCLLTKDIVPFACTDKNGKDRVMPGFDAVQVYKLMRDREDNAWNQLLLISDQAEALSRSSARAKRARDEYGKSPRLQDITHVTVQTTADRGSFVLRFSTAGGRVVSLWTSGVGELNQTLTVRSITEY